SSSVGPMWRGMKLSASVSDTGAIVVVMNSSAPSGARSCRSRETGRGSPSARVAAPKSGIASREIPSRAFGDPGSLVTHTADTTRAAARLWKFSNNPTNDELMLTSFGGTSAEQPSELARHPYNPPVQPFLASPASCPHCCNRVLTRAYGWARRTLRDLQKEGWSESSP